MSEGPLLRPLIESLLERIHGMEQSRFWQLRNRVFELKHRLGISRDRAWPAFAVPPSDRAILEAADPYATWATANAARPSDASRLRAASHRLAAKPTFSIIVPFEERSSELAEAVASVRAQAYPFWELLVVVATAVGERRARRTIARAFEDSAAPANVSVLVSDAKAASALLRTGLSRAGGDFVAFLSPGDALTSDALYEFAAALNDDPTLDLAYADEAVRAENTARYVPFFKPDWSPDSLRSRNYVGRGAIYRRALVEAVGGIRAAFEGAEEYDLVLRVSERARTIAHVPRVLYHRMRIFDTGEAGARAIGDSLSRAAEPGSVERVASPFPTYRVRYRLRESKLVSIIVPTRDHAEDLDRCLRSVFEKTTYPDFELLIVDNGTREHEAHRVLANWASRERRIRVLSNPGKFNYSKLNNRAARESRGYYLALLNNDTEVLSGDWLEAMMEQAQRPSIGAVGASLLFPDRRFQHGGVVLGIGGVAGHSHRFAGCESSGYFGALRAITNYAAVTAACLMVRRQLYEEAGGLDESLGVAFNDVDFCLRLLSRSYRNVWLPHVELVHCESKSRGPEAGFAKRWRDDREQRIMLARWGRWIACDPYYNPNLTRRAENFALRLELGH